MVVREHGGRGSNLSSHVANCGHSCDAKSHVSFNCGEGPTTVGPRLNLACTGYGVDPRTVVFYDGSGAPLHRQDAGHLQDDVLGRRPA